MFRIRVPNPGKSPDFVHFVKNDEKPIMPAKVILLHSYIISGLKALSELRNMKLILVLSVVSLTFADLSRRGRDFRTFVNTPAKVKGRKSFV